MIAGLIRWSVHNRLLVLLVTFFVTGWGIWSVQSTPIDAHLPLVVTGALSSAHDKLPCLGYRFTFRPMEFEKKPGVA